MINTLLGFFSFFELLGNPTFWLGLGLVAILGFLIFICIKYPKGGLPVLSVVLILGLAFLDAYCVLQINYYYNAKGGIYGALTGIFNTNEIEVVDNLTFEIKNIELTETTEGTYSASITTDQVLSLDTKQSLGIFVNDMPCDTTSEVHSDYAIAQYPYIFYDNDKSVICTDTLILNIAFYENSTYLTLSTKGGTLPVEECVKYWHHYFNKNGFIVKVAPFNNVSTDLDYTKGDVSNFAKITYYLDSEIYSVSYCLLNSNVELMTMDNNSNFIGWYTSDGEVVENIILTEDTELYAKFGLESVDISIKKGYVQSSSTGSNIVYSEASSPVIEHGGQIVDYGYSSSSGSYPKTIYYANFQVETSFCDSLTISDYTSLSVDTDGEYTLNELENGVCVSWTNCTYLSISIISGIVSSNAGLV